MSAAEWQRTDDFQASLGGKLSNLLEHRDNVGDRILHHYTDAAGLEGILRSNRLWATHVRFQNDMSEQRYAMQMIDDALQRWTLKLVAPPHLIGFMKTLAEFSRDLWSNHEAFIVCFCEEENLLNQWRVYSKTEGFSIGFNVERLMTVKQKLDVLNFERAFWLKKVLYNRAEQIQLIESVIETAISELNNLAPSPTILERAIHLTSAALAQLSITFKDPAFKDEHEWRMWTEIPKEAMGLSTDNATRGSTFVRCRTSTRGLLPYLEIDPTHDGRLPITEVWHGPTTRSDDTTFALERLLEQWGYGDVAIKGSTIPLRP